MRLALLPLTALAATACASASPDQLSVTCPNGSLEESDLTRGEQRLPDNAVVKIKVADQHDMTVRSDGRRFFPATAEDLSRYNLATQSDQTWFVALAGGVVGPTFDQAQANFYAHVPIYAFFYPATRKLVVSTTMPHVQGNKAFPFWIFLRAPNEVTTITYDCGTFD